jgi:hypothetical protein
MRDDNDTCWVYSTIQAIQPRPSYVEICIRKLVPTCRAARKAQLEAQKALKATAAAQNEMQAAALAASLNAGGRVDVDGLRLSSRRRSKQHASSIASTLLFTPVSVVWQDLSYYVTVAKGLTGAAAVGIMPADADKAIAGKKRLLNNLCGVPPALALRSR